MKMPDNRWIRRLGALVAVAGLIVGAIAVYAALTDQETVTDNRVTTTTAADIGLSLDSGWIVLDNMVPGSGGGFGHQPLKVTNLGPDPIHYSMEIAITETDGLGLSGHLSAILSKDPPGIPAEDICQTYPEMFVSGLLPVIEFGDPTPGIQAGDRSLGVGASEVLCLYVTVDATAPLNARTDFTFTFDAEKD